MTESYKPRKGGVEVGRRDARSHMGPQYSGVVQPNTIDIPLLHLSHVQAPKNVKTQQQSPNFEERSTNPRTVYENKEKTYKQQIQDLQNENESLKLKHKQALIRISHLYGKLKMFLTEDQINSDAIKIMAEETEKNNRQQYESLRQKTQSLISKHQMPVRNLLEQYGCSWQQSSIERCKSQSDIVQFLLSVFTEKAQILRKYEQQVSERIARAELQYENLKQSTKYATETNELYRIRESKYKERMDQVKQEWIQVCEKLARRELENEQISFENRTLKKQMEQYELQHYQHQIGSKSRVDNESVEIKMLQNQLSDMTNRVSEATLKYQQLFSAYEQLKLTHEEYLIKDRVREEEFERVNRQAVRWKERYEWLEKERNTSLQIIQAENIKLRDQMLLNKKYQLRQEFDGPVRMIHEHDMDQHSMRNRNNKTQHVMSFKKPLFESMPIDNEYSEHMDPMKMKNKASKKRVHEVDMPQTHRSGDVVEVNSPKWDVDRKYGGQLPADQRLQEVFKEFESKLWKMQDQAPEEM